MAKSGKKGAAAALQTKVTTDEEWEEILNRKGLVVVDVYSEWSGPCSAMVSTLRKIKMEIGGDVLSFALARNDEISSLERFRGKSEPTWMFLQNGKMVNLIFGAHCPKFQKIVLDELRRVQLDEPPKWNYLVTQRGSEEMSRWQQKENIRKAKENEKIGKEEAEKLAKYEEMMDQVMFELCEETALIFYPWVFLDNEGYPRDKLNCPAYTELVQNVLPEYFDISEQLRIQLNEEQIEKLSVESAVEISENLIAGLTQDKCMAMRLKARPPHQDWPVHYPYNCPEDVKRCPNRAIDDVENYLRSILEAPQKSERGSVGQSYIEKHVYVHEPDEEDPEDHQIIFPAIWIPPNARSKVHVFKTLFSSYMDKSHPYEEPVQPPPLCAFKFVATKLAVIQAAYQFVSSSIEKFGVFEFDDPERARRVASNPDDFENKVKYKTGNEIFVIVLRRTNEEAFLGFAGNEPYYVTEDNNEAEKIVEDYFPPEAVDIVPTDPDEEIYFDEYYDEEEEEEEEEDYEDENEVDVDIPPSFVDLSMF